ncbi:hypothetical protein K431DRAFT_302169 [Polychaeton citri CBS 116435]|uniref:LYR motif-containing protein Cup1-like N-terminal domain-containing protein n=1 Tax=Polychaeton citri CBS 116435 TaxID=1314669 RepID=A0A9P4URS4_9PEZI|nr:hypothetical protein K431DRAFT_302169 [Polychaeton citri CBS 116435]
MLQRDPSRGVKRLRDKVREARDGFLHLQQANQGDKDRLLKCLLTAYGRIGKKRRQLMAKLTKEEALCESENLTNLFDDLVEKTMKPQARQQYLAQVESRIKGLSRDGLDKARYEVEIDLRLKLLPARLRALARSQMTVNPPRVKGPRRLTPLIPEYNSWMKKMPENRIKNQIKKWYAGFLDRIQPPLPDDEWKDLLSKALGNYRDRTAIPPRRGQPSSNTTAPTALSMVASHGKVPMRYFGNANARVINSRFMRRLYTEVLWQCPKIDWDEAENQWRVTWGYMAYNRAIGPQGADPLPCDDDTSTPRL